MSNRLDIAFLGRSTARYPIVLKNPRRIEHDAKWRRFKDRAYFAAGCLICAFIVCVMGWAAAGWIG